ncbi:MAG: deoxyribose-phosphate aldolase [Aestuariivita sp.]|nr:deoxyribose-phosphate aldolase [Aestuariivita sp.]MCY4203956.1 deoxyribose-phosphate aldolase [Aestuariivita sp.]MCY4290105.1 deoxyribose-phosphate aldolase [Aestuariivita sp.]MCY4346481.1 deoxyribose-phosphate aldolase [Aestuariivita sp.]
MPDAVSVNAEFQDRNSGVPLDLLWLRSLQANPPAIERRVLSLINRRTIQKSCEAEWLAKIVSCIDLTTLSGDDTSSRVRQLCSKAQEPIRDDILNALGLPKLSVAAICVYHELIVTAIASLTQTQIPVAVVSTGFPAGLSPLPLRVEEIKHSIEAGAEEIDVVISRRLVLEGKWTQLFEEVQQFREASKDKILKVILATGELATLKNVGRASLVSMMAGTDFIKTSTGKETTNATLPVSLVMVRAIRDYFDRTGFRVGFKAAGGISTSRDALNYLILVKEELGPTWLKPNLFRFGASSLLADVERQLEYNAISHCNINGN